MFLKPVQMIPVKDFFSDETKSQYCAGMSYKVNSEALLELALRWEEEGKVELSDVDPSLGVMVGTL